MIGTAGEVPSETSEERSAPTLGIGETAFPYVLALDLAFSGLLADSEPGAHLVVLGVEAPTALELLARGGHELTLLAETAATGEAVRSVIDRAGYGDVALHIVDSVHPQTAQGARSAHLLWLSPDPSTWTQRLSVVDAYLANGGRLAIIGGGPLGPLLNRFRSPGTVLPFEAADARRMARRLGYSTIGWWQLYGLRSATWAILRKTADRLGRADLADRCEAAFRRSLAPSGRPGLWSLGVWLGQRP